ncbi:unnamed protein product [Ilex paraguariensis]|uniref:Uncharacterized protein n=1 Tax=Ilex paraguariensis TaxID=185542 RepID=A0ABC8UVN4_9AQUA
MVAVTTMGWFSEMGSRVGHHLIPSLSAESKKATHLGILAFETAKTMSRLVSLYRSLSDEEIFKLRKVVMKSEGVAYLNSKDEAFLFSLACAERLEDLDKVVAAVARSGHKCADFGLKKFDLVYTDLKMGYIDLAKLEYGSKEIEKKVQKMERLISATSGLYASLESLTELAISEQKVTQWKKNCTTIESEKMNFDILYQQIANQRKQVRHVRETSLWSKSFDKSVGLMARLVLIVYARMCVVFGPYIPVLPAITLRNVLSPRKREMTPVCLTEPTKEQVCSRSGPIPTSSKSSLVRFYSRRSILFLSEDNGYGSEGFVKNNRVLHAASPSTVGGSGLAFRYANVILLAEMYLNSPVTIDHDERENLYEMLPENLKMLVRSKLRKNVRSHHMEDDESLAEGWREALAAIMGWLAPLAHHTVKWQMEKNFVKMNFDSKPSVLLLQTLHFSDREKTDAAIAEVLVGLSCIYWYENRRSDEF